MHMVVPYLNTRETYPYIALIIFPFLIGRIVQILRLFKLRNQTESNLLFPLYLRELVAPRLPFWGRCPRARFRKVKYKPVSTLKMGDD